MSVFTAEWFPLGTFINGVCILLGGMLGLWLRRQLSVAVQLKFRYFLALCDSPYNNPKVFRNNTFN